MPSLHCSPKRLYRVRDFPPVSCSTFVHLCFFTHTIYFHSGTIPLGFPNPSLLATSRHQAALGEALSGSWSQRPAELEGLAPQGRQRTPPDRRKPGPSRQAAKISRRVTHSGAQKAGLRAANPSRVRETRGLRAASPSARAALSPGFAGRRTRTHRVPQESSRPLPAPRRGRKGFSGPCPTGPAGAREVWEARARLAGKEVERSRGAFPAEGPLHGPQPTAHPEFGGAGTVPQARGGVEWWTHGVRPPIRSAGEQS